MNAGKPSSSYNEIGPLTQINFYLVVSTSVMFQCLKRYEIKPSQISSNVYSTKLKFSSVSVSLVFIFMSTTPLTGATIDFKVPIIYSPTFTLTTSNIRGFYI